MQGRDCEDASQALTPITPKQHGLGEGEGEASDDEAGGDSEGSGDEEGDAGAGEAGAAGAAVNPTRIKLQVRRAVGRCHLSTKCTARLKNHECTPSR